jgi:hypothetical protein
MRADTAGRKAKLIYFGRGENLSFPAPATAERLLAQDGRVRVQLVNSDGQCWSADFLPGSIRDRVDLFKDKCGQGRQGPCS